MFFLGTHMPVWLGRSATVLAMARADGFAAHALRVDYGQRQRRWWGRRTFFFGVNAVDYRRG